MGCGFFSMDPIDGDADVSGKPLQWQVGKDKQQELGLQDNPFGSKIETVRD